MQGLSGFLGLFGFLAAFAAVSTIFDSAKSFPFKSKIKAIVVMVLIAVASFGLKLFVVDNYAETYDSDYRTVYLAANKLNHEEFSKLVSSALADNKMTKNEYKEIKKASTIDFYDLDKDQPLNINNQSITPIKLDGLGTSAVTLSAGLGTTVLYMGILIALTILAAGSLKFKRLREELKSKDSGDLTPEELRELRKSFLRFEFWKKPSGIYFIFGSALLTVSCLALFWQSASGDNYKKELDEFFKANSHIPAIQEFETRIYANGKVSDKELSEALSLPETLEKTDIIDALK